MTYLHYHHSRISRFPLQERFLSTIVASGTKIMGFFASLHAFLQGINSNARSDAFKLIAGLLCSPCFKLGFFFFKLAYSAQQIRLRRLGLHCARLGGHDFSRQFEDLRLNEVSVANIFHSLRDFHNRTQRSHETRHGTYIDHDFSPNMESA